MTKIAFIGAGNMASALVAAMVSQESIQRDSILVTDRHAAKSQQLADSYSVTAIETNCAAVSQAKYLLLAVKPHVYAAVIDEIRHVLTAQHVVISIAAGLSLKQLHHMLPDNCRVVRAMPNLAAMVGEGMTTLCFDEQRFAAEEQKVIKAIFRGAGEVMEMPEKLMDVAMAIAGSSPALVFMFIEALADGAVLRGMPRQQAYALAGQAVLGSAKLMRQLDEHPAVLKDRVASPGGTTIEAIAQLEAGGFRGSIIEAVDRCIDKAKQLSAE